jgi:hypothetical protein
MLANALGAPALPLRVGAIAGAECAVGGFLLLDVKSSAAKILLSVWSVFRINPAPDKYSGCLFSAEGLFRFNHVILTLCRPLPVFPF